MQPLYFFFEPLSFEKFTIQFKTDAYSLNVVRIAYLRWVMGFCRESLIFYQNQYRIHSQTTWLEFCNNYKIPDYEHPSNFDLETEWEDWKEGYLLNSHYEEYQEFIRVLSSLQDSTRKELESSPLILDDTTIPLHEINRIWFNDLIDNSPQIIAELKSLDYRKGYLQTTHWRRIRAAMFLINRATCQASECNVVGESWYGGSESGLDVHHLTYANRGNERFEDLALLCRQHHEYFHSNNNEVPPNSEENEKIFLEDIFEDDKGQ